MRFVDSARVFELDVERYEFQDSVDEWDANWLIVRGFVNDGARSWRFRDPCLLTIDLPRLASWLRAVAADEPATNEIDFLEPNLRIRLVDRGTSTVRLDVIVELEARPPWLSRGGAREVPEVAVSFALPRSQLIDAADSLRDASERFPVRGAVDTEPGDV